MAYSLVDSLNLIQGYDITVIDHILSTMYGTGAMLHCLGGALAQLTVLRTSCQCFGGSGNKTEIELTCFPVNGNDESLKMLVFHKNPGSTGD